MTALHRVFSTWDDALKEFTNVAREVTRKRAEKFIPIKVDQRSVELLRERCRYFRGFRKMHEQLRVMVGPALKAGVEAKGKGKGGRLLDGEGGGRGIGEVDMEHEVSPLVPLVQRARIRADEAFTAEQVKLAYESIKAVDVLDVSPRSSPLVSLSLALVTVNADHARDDLCENRRDRPVDLGRSSLHRSSGASRESAHRKVEGSSTEGKAGSGDVSRLFEVQRPVR